MKVVTSCRSRFWIFDQAAQLHRHGVLHRLINDYPKFMTRRWGIPDQKVDSLLANGIYAQLVSHSAAWLDDAARDRLARSVHHEFEVRLARHLPRDTEVFIGLSAFSLEAVRRARRQGAISVIDHGSIHQRLERQLQLEERELWGLPSAGHLPWEWMLEQQQEEFLEADWILTLSERAKRTLVSQGVPEEKIFPNNPGVNLTHFRPGVKHDDVFRVIQVGGIHQGKGVQYLLRAFHELKLPRSELWFVGGGLQSTSLKPVIERYRADNVVFKGSFPQHELQQLYAQCSVFVLPSIADGFGMVVPQAMACGLPVIVTENTGAADIVTEGKSGYVIPIRDVEALKERLLRLYERPELREEMGRAAKTATESGCSWDDYGDRLVAFLRRVSN
ncbi:MAG: glycosyltransferase family 4 protein [Deltaproteobacteria bacterium]|nr:glycosyltransferase family 4 protein [Deltaproteobacteria bacterium]